MKALKTLRHATTRLPALSVVLLAIPLLAFGPIERSAPTQWALIIGISEYPHLDAMNQLPGAALDARAMREVLVERWGFLPENVRLLLNGDATRAGISEAATEWLRSATRPGDQITLYFAGHGSRTWAGEGAAVDGVHQTLAPSDVRIDSADFDITDRELKEWLQALPLRDIVVVLDNGHVRRAPETTASSTAVLSASSTVMSTATGTTSTTNRMATPFARPRALDRDLAALARPDGASQRMAPAPGEARGMELGGESILELAAARPHEPAVEVLFGGDEAGESFYGGAFTTALVQRLWAAPPGATYREILGEVRNALKRSRFEQEPRITSAGALGDAAIFAIQGGGASMGDGRFPVYIGGESRLEFGAGQAVGLTVGSVLEVEGGALVLIDRVTRDRSSGMILGVDTVGPSPEGDAVAGAGGAPVRSGTADGAAGGGARGGGGAATRGVVSAGSENPTASDGPAELQPLASTRRVDQKARLRAIAFPEAPLLVRVAGVDSMTRATMALAAAEMESLHLAEEPGSFAHLVVRGAGDEIQVIGPDDFVRHVFPSSASGHRDLRAALQKEASAKRLADMENIAQPFPMQVSLAGDRTSFAMGQTVSFHAVAEREGYLTLVDLGADGTITVLFPNPYDRDNHVRAGQEITFPTASFGSEIVAMPPAGRGMVRAFLTPQPLALPVGEDFTAGEHALADAIAEAVKNAAGRAPGAPGAVRLDSWGTASISYDIRR